MSAPRGHRAETYISRAHIGRAHTSRAEPDVSRVLLAGPPDVDDHPEGEHFPARPFATARASGQWTGMGRAA